jgi:hypothetical protein
MRRSNLWWGIILVCAGALLLLDNLGVLAPLNIKAGPLIFSLALIGLGAWTLWASQQRHNFTTEELNIPLEGEEVHVNLDFGAGELRVAGAALSETLLSGTFEGVEYDVSHEGGRQRVRLSSPSFTGPYWVVGPGQHRRWTMALNNAVPLTITVKTGASDARLDLSDLQVTRLKLESGANSTRVIAPAHAGYTEIRGASGAASLSVEIPEGVAARIRTGGALASISIDRERFPNIEGEYRSPDYETAANKVDIKLEMGVGSISVR